jgi:hypothetical protein
MSNSTRRGPRVKPPRTVILSGEVLRIREGSTRDVYTFAPLPADFGAAYQLGKLVAVPGPDGSKTIEEQPPYHLLLDLAGSKTKYHSCECKGWLRWHKCRHVSCLLALHAKGKLPVPTEVKPVQPPTRVHFNKEDAQRAVNCPDDGAAYAERWSRVEAECA